MKRIFSLLLVTLLMTFTSLGVYAKDTFPIIMYHNVTNDPELVKKDDTVHITADTLESHFIALKNAGYNAISMNDYYLYRTQGKTLAPNPVLITFDDGYISNYEIAYPMLQEHKLKATIFVIASRMGADNVEFHHFTWDQAREMDKSGFVEIESHTFTHPDFSKINYSQSVVEMRLSKFAIETNLGRPCRFFAYPYGKMNQWSTLVANKAGYKMVCVGRDVNASLLDENPYELPRYTVRGTWSGEELIDIIKTS